jgi:hypothetical protein
MAGWPDSEQAKALTVLYSLSVDVAGKCMKTRDVLIQWIKGE